MALSAIPMHRRMPNMASAFKAEMIRVLPVSKLAGFLLRAGSRGGLALTKAAARTASPRCMLLSLGLGVAAPIHAQSAQAWFGLFRQDDFAALEAQTITFLERFAQGKETEFSLRQAYRPSYSLTAEDLQRLDKWQREYPRSYSARLIRGTYYKRAAFAARGTEFLSRTPPENLAEMYRLQALAIPPLKQSLSLMEKPYLSVFHLLDLQDNDRSAQKALMDTGTKMLPTNRLIRARYMRSLRPRWGGSYPAMKAFLATRKAPAQQTSA